MSDLGLASTIRSAAALAVAVGIAISAPALAADSAVVTTLLGNWGGSGRIHYTDGSTETIRCTAYYTGGGSELHMAIQCQGQGNPIHMRSRLKIDGARASGSWEERTFNASGNATGKASGDSMSLSLAGGGFSGSMAVSFSKSQHSVNITTQGIGMSKASISFNRR
ncbi:MAG: hypothetical protein ABL904_04000 [Hyphomicrobiaceae bacterium]